MNTTETITWVSASTPPDDEQTVLIYAPQEDDPIWLGYHDGDAWREASGGQVSTPVTHWAEMPKGPSTSATTKEKCTVLEKNIRGGEGIAWRGSISKTN